MNKIFKVIWSKSKQCYVVVSEVAKNNTGKKKIVVASILAGLAMLTSGGVSNVVAVSTIPFTDKPSTALANGTVKNTTTNGVAIGNAAYSESNQSIAIGFRSLASGTAMGGTIQPSVAIGAGAHAEANNTVAIGTVAENRASYGVSLGNQSNVTSGSDYGIAVGYQAKVSAIHGMALGERAASSGQISVAIGANAKAAGANSYAGGFNSASSGASSVALGESATSSGDTSVAIGKNTVASGGDAVSIGASSQATGSDSLALGKNARANNGDTIAIGQDSVANSLNGVALGKTSKATGASATALGPQSTASATLSTAIGMNSVANQEYATAIGGGSQATAVRGVALGTYSKADTASGVSGYDANANRTNKYAGLTGNTLTSSWGAVSIGDGTNTRQMTGLAAGTKDTDAVNVAQLKSVNLAFTGDNSSSGDVNLANSKLAVTGDTTYITTTAANQGITVKGVKKDITVSNGTASANAGMADAKNVAEAINQANADQKITYKANGSTANSVKLSDGLNFTNGSSTVATVGNNGQVTYDLNAATKKSITDSEAAVKRTISLGADSGTRSSQSLNSNNVAFNIKGYTGSYITTAMVGDTLTINTTRGTIQSDASGTASLSGSDGLATAQNVATAINKAKDGSAWNLAVNTGAAQKVAGGAKVTLQNGNNIALTQTGTTITVGTTSQLTADTVTVGSGTNQIVLNGTNGEVSGKIIKTGNSTLNTNGLTISGGPSVTSTGINAGGKEIKGIADATAADSAVSKGQMDTAIANAQTAATSTEKVVAKTLTGDNNLATVTGQTGTAKNETYEVAVSENAVKAVASNAAQDAVKVAGTGLATVSDATVAGVKTYTVNVEEGKLVLDDTTGNVGAAGSTQGTTAGKDGVATTQNVAKAINEAVTKANANNAQALADAEHKFDGDTGTTSVRKHGEVLSVKGGVTTPANLTTGNIGVVSDGAGTLNVRLAKALTGLTSAAYTDGAGNTQIVTGASSTITDGAGKTTSMTKDGLSTTDGKNTTTVAPTGVTATDGTHTVKVEGTGIDAGNTELKHVAAGTAATSAVNKQQMEDAVKAGGTWKITTNTGATTEVTGGDTVDFINGDNIVITNTGRNITIGTAKAVSFDKVTVGGITIDKTDGINAGGKEIKGIADATAADSAVSKGQMDTAIANAQTAATSTEKVVAKTLTGDNNLATVTGQTGTAKNETYEVAVSENAVKAVASNAAQDAVKVAGTGLATVSDTTTGGVKTYTVNVEEGKLVLDDATGNVGAAGSTQGTTAGKDGVATTQNVAKAINDAVTKVNANNAQALADAEHKFDGDTGTTSVRKHGEVLSIKGGVTTPADLTTGNIGVVSDGAGTLNVRLAKALTGLTSATYTDAAGNTTTVTGGSTTIADAAGNTQTLAPTKSEIKDAAGVSTVTTKDGVTATDAAGNTTALTKGGLSTTDGTNTTTVTPNGMTATDGTNTVKVEGSGIDAGNTEIKNVVAGTTATSAVNKQQMEDAVKAGGTWKVTTNTSATTEVTGGDTVDFINGDNIAITNTGRNITIGTAKTVSFDKVTVGGITIDKTDGINAGGKEIKGIADGTAADSAVSKGQMDTAIANAQTAATSTEKVVAKTLTGDNNLATVTGQTGTAKNETYEVAVSENAVKAVAVNAAQDAVNVVGTGLATVSDATTGGVKTYTVNVEEGKLVLDDATGNVGAAGSTQGTTAGKDGVATTQNVAKAINDAVTKVNANNAQALADAEHKFDGDTGTTSVRKHGEVLSIKGGVTTPADLTTGNIGVVSDGAGTLNVRLAKVLTGLTSATYTDAAGNTTTVTGGTTTIADAAGNTQTLAPTKSEIKDAAGVSTVTTKDGVTATDAAGNTTALTNGGVSTTDGAGNTTALTKGGLSTTDGTNTTTVTPNGMTATDGTNTVKVEGSGIDAGNTEIKNVAAGTTNTSAVNKKQMDDAINKATGDATHEFGGDDTTVVSRKHGEKLNIKGGASTTAADLTDGNIAVLGDATTGTLNLKLAKALTGLTSATYTDAAGNTTTVTGGTTTIADAAGNTQTLAPTKSEIKDAAGVSTVTTKDGVTATDAAGNTTALTKGGLSTTDGTNTTTVTPNGMTATDGTNTVKVKGSGIDAGNTEIKNVAAGTTNTSAVNKKQMDDAISKATGDATHEFGGDDTTVVSRKHGEQLNIKGGASTAAADLTDGNIAVLGDATTGTLNLKLAKALTGLTSATYTDAAGNTTTVTGGSTTIADAAGNTQTLAPTKSEIKDNAGVSTVTTKDGVTAKDGNGNSTALTKGGVSTTDGAGNTTALTKGGLSTTDGTNTTTVTPNGMTATDGIHTVKVAGSGIDAGNTEIKNVAAGTTNTSAVNKKQMDDAISKATADATHEFGGDTGNTSVRKHGEVLSIKGGVTDTTKLSDNNIGVVSDGAGTLNVKLAKDLIGLNSATYTDAAGNTTTVTGGTTTITDAAGNTQTLAPTKSEIKDAAGVSTVTTKDGVTAKDAAGNTTALTNGGVSTTDGAGNTTALTKGGLSTTDGTNTTTVTPNGLTATDGTNTVKVNGSGIDAGNTEIKNVADGTTPHSAINKNQLDTAVNRLQNATDNISLNIAGNNGTGNVKLKDQVLHIDGTNGLTTKANGQSLTVGLDDATMSTINNTAALANNAAKKDLSNIDQAGKDVIKDTAAWHVKVNSKAPELVKGGDTVTFNDGHNITITNTGKDITVATKKEVTFDKVSVGGITIDKQADHISGVSSITGSGSGAPTMTFNASNGSTPSSVSMDSNLDMGGKQINNVAAATRPTDAVNKQQVDQAVKSLAGMADSAAKKYASKAGANAAALAALKPIQYDPLAPTQIMAGIGNYKSQTAVALGVAHYTNEDTMFNIGASLDSQDAMLNAGVTHKFGSSTERKNIPDRYKGGPISSIYVMQDEVSALKAQNSEMQAMLDKQSSENAAIIAENKMLREQNEEMQRKVDLILSKLQ